MKDEEEVDDGHISQIDLRCSVACTRAGYIVLALSAIGFSLLHPLDIVRVHEALGEYVVHRINLSAALEHLEEESCWQHLLKTKNNAGLEELPFGKLLDISCEFGKEGIRVNFPKEVHVADKNNASIGMPNEPQKLQRQDDHPPGIPADLRISASIPALDEIKLSMTGLGDGKVLAVARQASVEFNYSIYRWAVLLRSLKATTREKIQGTPVILLGGGQSTDNVDPGYVPDLSTEDLKSFLTLADIRKLAKVEKPELPDFEKVAGGASKISIPLASIPVTTSFASTLIEAGLLFSLMYFWLFQQEAQASKNFPAPGTLFSALNRSVGSRSLFVLMILISLSCAVLIAWRSLPNYTYYKVNWAIAGCVVLVAFTVGWTSKVLKRRKR